MSMTFYRQPTPTPVRRQALARLFGKSIEITREARGRSLEEAAGLAGMESSQWAAIEAGHVPGDPAQLRSIAAALEFGYEQILQLAWLCREAWEQ